MTTAEGVEAIRQLARSRTVDARSVQRVRIVWRSGDGKRVPPIATKLQIGQDTVRMWIKRFKRSGVTGLADCPRSGKPSTYIPEQAER